MDFGSFKRVVLRAGRALLAPRPMPLGLPGHPSYAPRTRLVKSPRAIINGASSYRRTVSPEVAASELETNGCKVWSIRQLR